MEWHICNLEKVLQFVPKSSPLELAAFDDLGSLPCNAIGNKYIVVLTDIYSKHTRAMPTGRTSSSHVANVFFDPSLIFTVNLPMF